VSNLPPNYDTLARFQIFLENSFFRRNTIPIVSTKLSSTKISSTKKQKKSLRK
jgi:hypothetical protein